MSENQSIKNIHWFPGHMKKASVKIEEKLKYVDFVIVILDARAIRSSLNDFLMKIIKDKKKLFLISKKDLGNEIENEKWEKYLEKEGDISLLVDLKDNSSINRINKAIEVLIEEKRNKNKSRGIMNFVLKAMVIGIPNVGKSSFINLMAKKAIAKAENRPGLTRSVTWIKVNKNFELMDTPGILLPKFNNENEAINLALIGTIKEDILPLDMLFERLVKIIKKDYLELFYRKYELDIKNLENHEILESFAKKRGFLLKDGELDLERAMRTILNDFKNGKIGRITLEKI